jgi:glucose/arabinose dehydrogenase/plastocyanin
MHSCFRLFLITILALAFVLLPSQYYASSTVYAAVSKPQLNKGPIINDQHLGAEIVFKGGLNFPTSMAFLGPDDILVLDKNKGTVNRIVNGTMLKDPLLDVKVATKSERGMLGIAVAPKHENNKPTYVFLYYTESKAKDGEDVTTKGHVAKEPLGNRLYRYELANSNSKLINPKLLLDIPTSVVGEHNGGRILIGPHDNNVYVIVGDASRGNSQTSNAQKGTSPIGRAGILRITQDGKPIGSSILGDQDPLNKYYAYGLRNGFGIDFDPMTKKLWDTENGPNFGDEINLVNPGFNSGWIRVQGFWKINGQTITNVTSIPKGLVDFGGKGKYSPPEFTWFKPTAGPTAIKFLNSDKLGEKYENDMFVGDFHNGYLYHFDLNKKRTGLVLHRPLSDKVANNPNELQKAGIIFGKRFGGITDIQVGPDGYLYVLSLYQGGDNCGLKKADKAHCIPYSSSLEGTIFRIFPIAGDKENPTGNPTTTNSTTAATNTNQAASETTTNESNTQQEENPAGIINNNSTLPSTNTSNNISIVQDAYIMTDKAFSPNPVTVKVGDTITWTNNDDDQPHTVTSGNGPDDPNKGKAFDSGPSALATTGKTFQHKFTEAGQYPYFCELHPMMVGKIIVSSFK